MTTESVLITGLGIASAYGHTFDALAEGVLAGRSVIRKIEHFNVEQHPAQIGGPMGAVPCPEGVDAVAFRALPRLEQAFHWCAVAALRDAGLWEQRATMRLGVCVGVGAEWLQIWEEDHHAGGRALYEPGRESRTLAQRLGGWLGVRGPSGSVSGACASGNHAIAAARTWLQMGWVDAVLTGACDAGVSEFGLAAFGNLRALSRRNTDPVGASRPFDKGRDGFVVGEGGMLCVLERAGDARRRSASVYAEVAGYGSSSDAHHMVIPSPSSAQAAEAIKIALRDASINPDEIGYINAHATSTPVGDTAEARALHNALGTVAGTIPISSTKSMTGHLLTAAAALEAAICLVALRRQVVPPTINLTQPDPECPLGHIANVAQERPVKVALSNSFGFGGSNTSLLLRAA